MENFLRVIQGAILELLTQMKYMMHYQRQIKYKFEIKFFMPSTIICGGLLYLKREVFKWKNG